MVGHHLFGAGSTHAAVTLKNWLQATGFTQCQELPGGAARSGLIATKP